MREQYAKHKISIWIGIITVALAFTVAFGGVAVGYGGLKARVDTVEQQQKVQNTYTNQKLERIENILLDMNAKIGEIKGKQNGGVK